MGIRDTFDLLLRHPLNRERKLKAVLDYLRWQTSSLIAPGPIAVPYVNDTRLLASFGMSAATGNIYAGLYELEDMAFVGHFLRPGELLVDVGANIGSYTVLAGAVGARAIAFEPVPATFAVLRDNVRLNALTGVEVRNVAVGATSGLTRFTHSLGAMNRVAQSGEQSIEVPVDTLDHLLAGERPTVIKVDVEGFESAVIDGAHEVLAQTAPGALLLERNGNGARFGFDEAALHQRILDQGFSAWRYQPFERELVAWDHAPAPSYGGNTLYLRDAGAARERLATAPPLRVREQLV